MYCIVICPSYCIEPSRRLDVAVIKKVKKKSEYYRARFEHRPIECQQHHSHGQPPTPTHYCIFLNKNRCRPTLGPLIRSLFSLYTCKKHSSTWINRPFSVSPLWQNTHSLPLGFPKSSHLMLKILLVYCVLIAIGSQQERGILFNLLLLLNSWFKSTLHKFWFFSLTDDSKTRGLQKIWELLCWYSRSIPFINMLVMLTVRSRSRLVINLDLESSV